ncbi:MAG: tyrosine--tRNA ligase [Planctomycetota bacterium]
MNAQHPNAPDLGLAQLLAGCEHTYSDAELKHKLEKSARDRKPLRVKLGMDPTAPDIHFGHAVVLGKLRQFQDLGHKAVLIIGDFTARIGDPTGRSETRKMLSAEDIRANAETYISQAGKILDTSPEKFEVRWNGEWLDKMTFADVLKLTARMTIGQLLKRDDFRKRFESETPIGLHEFLYPLVQGWDSVNIEADVELGGTDQMYNNLVGRDLQQSVGQHPQVVLLMPLLRGLDGVRKMSKSYGNHIALTDSPLDMFGKTMSIPDDLLAEWYRLLTPPAERMSGSQGWHGQVETEGWHGQVGENAPQAGQAPSNQGPREGGKDNLPVPPAALAQPALNPAVAALIASSPMEAKKQLAVMAGARFHGQPAMLEARASWEKAFSGSKTVETVDVLVPASEIVDGKIQAWKLCWLAHDQEISKSEARRMVENGAFEFAGQKITDPNTQVAATAGAEFRAGRHRKGDRVKQPLVARITAEKG